MRFVDEYRGEPEAQALFAALRRDTHQEWNLMEVCGGQTHTLMRSGIDRLLPDVDRTDSRSRLPGLRDAARADRPALAIARRPEVIFTSFGDMLRVPGLDHRPAGGQVGRAATCAWSTRRSTR